MLDDFIQQEICVISTPSLIFPFQQIETFSKRTPCLGIAKLHCEQKSLNIIQEKSKILNSLTL